MEPRRPASPLLAACALALALLVACRPSAPTPNATSYFPLQVGMRWVYETTFYGPRSGTSETTVAVCRMRDDADLGRVFLVSTCAADALVHGQLIVLNGKEVVQPITVNREGESRPRDPPEVIARTDLRVGQQWRYNGTIGDLTHRSVYVVANRGKVLTPAGEFDAVRVFTVEQTDGPPPTVERWYAPGVGLVREAGAALLPTEGGQLGLVELVRTLKQHDRVSVDAIPCCGRAPPSFGG